MGMFDELRCKYPLPVEGANELDYQTKDLDNALNQFEIREDGTLWVEEYDVEDHSDPNAVGIERFFGCATRVNKRWKQVHDFEGEIEFYTTLSSSTKDVVLVSLDGEVAIAGPRRSGWIQFKATFQAGVVERVELAELRGIGR